MFRRRQYLRETGGAIDFDGAADHLRLTATPPNADTGVSMSAWINPDVVTGNHETLGFFDDVSNATYITFQIIGTTAYFTSRDSDNTFASAGKALVANRWQHYMGVQYSTTSRYCWLDNVIGSENTDANVNSTVFDRITIGCNDRPSQTNFFDGRIAHGAIWMAGLGSAEVEALSRGAHPFSIRPHELLFYAPLTGADFDRVWYRGKWTAAAKFGAPALARGRQFVRPYAHKTVNLPIAAGGVTTQTRTTLIDALLQRQGLTRTTVIDALLQRQGLTKTTQIDALLQKSFMLSTLIDALLQKQGLTRTALIDALLQKSFTRTTLIDALLQGTLTATTQIDALLTRAGILTTQIDALLQRQGLTKTTSVDALLQKAFNLSVQIDAVLVAAGVTTETVTCNIDAVLVGAWRAKTDPSGPAWTPKTDGAAVTWTRQ